MENEVKRFNGAQWVVDWQVMTILKSNGYKGAWVVIDFSTRAIVDTHFVRVRSGRNAMNALRKTIGKHGCPSEIVVDQGAEWRSKAVMKLAREYGAALVFLPSRSPSFKARVEAIYLRMANAINA